MKVGDPVYDKIGLKELNEEENQIVQKTQAFVYDFLKDDKSGHDWWHIERVTRMTIRLAREETNANLLISILSALLHDMIDDKLVANENLAIKNVQEFLLTLEVPENQRLEIMVIIQNLSFKGGQTKAYPLSLEGQIVQDADRLDAMGAIGIARTIYYSGHKGRPIHDPTMVPRENMSLADYRNGKDSAIMHFYEKLLKLKDLMNTSTGRQLAIIRHAYLEDFLEQFYQEWEANR